MPTRYQLRRVKGYKKPAGVINVARPTKWGNPFNWQEFKATNYPEKRRMAVEWYEKWLNGDFGALYQDERDEILSDIQELTGKNLACWCPLDEPCHADVLLHLANNGVQANAQAPQQVQDWKNSKGIR